MLYGGDNDSYTYICTCERWLKRADDTKAVLSLGLGFALLPFFTVGGRSGSLPAIM